MKKYDVTALGELLIDFTENGTSQQGNPLFEANPGGAPCNVLAMLQKLGRKTAFIGKVGNDSFGNMLKGTVTRLGINTDNLLMDDKVPTTLAFVHTAADGDRSFSFYRNPGADKMLRTEEVSNDLIADSKIFHFGSLSMTDQKIEETTKAAVAAAKDSGGRMAPTESAASSFASTSRFLALFECSSRQNGSSPTDERRRCTTESAACFSAMNRTVLP